MGFVPNQFVEPCPSFVGRALSVPAHLQKRCHGSITWMLFLQPPARPSFIFIFPKDLAHENLARDTFYSIFPDRTSRNWNQQISACFVSFNYSAHFLLFWSTSKEHMCVPHNPPSPGGCKVPPAPRAAPPFVRLFHGERRPSWCAEGPPAAPARQRLRPGSGSRPGAPSSGRRPRRPAGDACTEPAFSFTRSREAPSSGCRNWFC